MVAQKIGDIELGLHVRADLLEGHTIPGTLEEVIAFGLIGVESENAMIRALRTNGISLDVGDFAFRSDSDLAHVAAVRAGVGIGVYQVALARRDPRLIRILPGLFSYPMETWVVMHEDLRNVAPVRAVFDAVVAGLRDYLADAIK